MDEMSSENKQITRITPHRGLLHIPLRELWEYRELIGLLAHRDFVSQYKQTVLGSFWYILQPLLQSFMFIFVFSNVAKIPTGDLPPMLFYLSGIVCWRYFSDCVTKTANTFTGNQHLFDKVYFPRLAVPISQLITNLVGFSMGFVMFLGFYLWYYFHGVPIHPDWRDFWDDESLSRLAGFARFLHATLDVCELRSLSAQGGATELPLGL
ncbi:MAG: hypothetical protein EBY32_02365 [Proteobacteria bacterium]|nr:hypothetical protein [Pseudomonadota bacterium]